MASKKDMKAIAKKGAPKGGKARASVLTKEQRSEIARKAARARWGDPAEPVEVAEVETAPAAAELPYSLLRGELTIGDVKIECHVLNDYRRVFTQREVVRVLSGGRGSGDLMIYLKRNALFDPKMLEGRVIQFNVATPNPANGYEATLLIEIADLYLRARDQNKLKQGQERMAMMADTIIRSCAKVGIIALVDEATGFQRLREKRALQLKLQAFIAEDMQEWAKMFPDEFWFELARLEGTHYSPRHRPLRWGRYVMAFVYDAVDGDVGKELRKKNPNPHFKRNHHQWLKDFGRDRVQKQIWQVVAVMKVCDDMTEFRAKFAKVFSKQHQLELDLWGEPA
ncbi:MAG: hypothetical protein JWM72_1611 [Actinomycetia bacterium]|nr:hypothetical protein [Actinomycetes bacterium]